MDTFISDMIILMKTDIASFIDTKNCLQKDCKDRKELDAIFLKYIDENPEIAKKVLNVL